MMPGRNAGERIDMIYWVEGDYIKEALREVDHFMRDWRCLGHDFYGSAHHRHYGGDP